MLAGKFRLPWSWWWAFAVLIAAPAVALALMGLRAVGADKLERLQQVSEHQTQLARLADVAIRSWLSEVENELRKLDAGRQSEQDVAMDGTSSRLLSNSSTVFTLSYSHLGLSISNQKTFFGDETEGSGAFPRWPPAIEQWIYQAQAAEAQSRLAEAARHYMRIAAKEPRLREWSDLALARISHLKLDEQDLSDSDGLAPTGVPVALISTAYLEAVPRQERRHLDLRLVETLKHLRSGRWWLSYDQRRFYDNYIRQLLDGGRAVLSDDPVLASVAEIERIVRAAPPLKRDGPSHGFWKGDSRGFLIAWLPSVQDSKRWVGVAFTQEALDELMKSVLAPVIAGQRFPATLLDNRGAALFSADELVTVPFSTEPVRSIAGWEMAFGSPRGESSLGDRQLVWYGLVLLLVVMLGVGIAMTIQVVRRQKELTRRQDDFVTGISHEFKSPITGIRLLIDRMKSGGALQPAELEYQAAIGWEIHRLERHVDRLLEAQQISEGRKIYSFEFASINDIVQTAVDELQHSADNKGISVEARPDPHTPVVRLDKAALTDALANLIDNAIKYSGSDTVITVGVRSDADFAFIEVSDRGLGIEAHDLSHIFERFYRGRRANQHSPRGTGLGLALVKAAVEAHGGDVNVHSTPGRGSSFAIRLPLSRDLGAQSTQSAS